MLLKNTNDDEPPDQVSVLNRVLSYIKHYTGNNYRRGAVSDRSQTKTPSGAWVKRDGTSGRFMDQKSNGEPFKGVRKER